MDPFIGEVRMFTWNWAPSGWALCDGSSLFFNQNTALGALLGNTYGSNGTTTFNLPDLRGRTPVHVGRGQDGLGYNYGQVGGVEAVSLTTAQIPQHTHSIYALSKSAGNATGPKSALPATVGSSGAPAINIYSLVDAANLTQLSSDTLSTEGASAPHNNMQPFVVMNFCIATAGIFPPRL